MICFNRRGLLAFTWLKRFNFLIFCWTGKCGLNNKKQMNVCGKFKAKYLSRSVAINGSESERMLNRRNISFWRGLDAQLLDFVFNLAILTQPARRAAQGRTCSLLQQRLSTPTRIHFGDKIENMFWHGPLIDTVRRRDTLLCTYWHLSLATLWARVYYPYLAVSRLFQPTIFWRLFIYLSLRLW